MLDPIECVIDNILACENTFSSSLHGIIVSHAYNIPSLRVNFQASLGDLKFHDYFLSVGIEKYIPIDFSKKVPKNEELIKIIEDKHDFTIPNKDNIEKNKKNLMDSCPFV